MQQKIYTYESRAILAARKRCICGLILLLALWSLSLYGWRMGKAEAMCLVYGLPVIMAILFFGVGIQVRAVKVDDNYLYIKRFFSAKFTQIPWQNVKRIIETGKKEGLRILSIKAKNHGPYPLGSNLPGFTRRIEFPEYDSLLEELKRKIPEKKFTRA